MLKSPCFLCQIRQWNPGAVVESPHRWYRCCSGALASSNSVPIRVGHQHLKGWEVGGCPEGISDIDGYFMDINSWINHSFIVISRWFPWFSNQMFTRLQIPSQWWTSNGAFRAIGLGGDSIIGKLAPGEWGRQGSKVVEPRALIAKGGTGHGTPPASRD